MHFYRNVFTAVPSGKAREVAAMLKAIHAQEDLAAAREKAALVVVWARWGSRRYLDMRRLREQQHEQESALAAQRESDLTAAV